MKTRRVGERTIYREGRPIEVVTIEPAGMPSPPPRRRHDPKSLFVRLTHADAVAGCKALDCPMMLVWYALLYRSWAEKSDTVRMPTALLRSWGVNRWTGQRALVRLKRAGLIQTEHHPGRSTICRLLNRCV